MPKNMLPPEAMYPPALETTHWLVLGLDLSTTRTGYALFRVVDGEATALRVGSISPADTSLQVWQRCSMVGHTLLDLLHSEMEEEIQKGASLLFAVEAFTPRNDFLSSINRVVNTVLLGKDSPLSGAKHVRSLYLNPSTLRRILGLKEQGTKNKEENKALAYKLVLDEAEWPGLDTDSCDACLMAYMGKWVTCILSGKPGLVPDTLLLELCNPEMVNKGTKKAPKMRPKGLLHYPEYLVSFIPGPHQVRLRDGRDKASAKAAKATVKI